MHRALTNKLYNIIEDLAYLGYRIDSNIEKIEDLDSKNANKMRDALNALKETLVITTGDRYVKEAEPELREKLSELYNNVVSTFEKPAPVYYTNTETYQDQLNDAWKTYNSIEKKYLDKVNSELEASQKETIVLKTKAEFLAD